MQRTYVEIVNARPVGYLTIEEYAKKLNVSQPAVRQMLTRGRIASLKIGNEHWIHEDTIPITKRPRHKNNYEAKVEFISNVKTARIEKGLSQEAMAKYLGVSRRAYIAFESNKVGFPNKERMKQICTYLEIDIPEELKNVKQEDSSND